MNRTDGEAATRRGLLPANPTRLLICGCALLVGYFAVAGYLDGFIDPDLDYHSVFSHQPIGTVSRPFDRDFAKHSLLSVTWKMLLLFPAAICLTLYAAMRASRERIERFLARLSALQPLRALLIMLLVVLLLLVFISHVILQRQPVYDDERAYEFQARVLGTGRCYAEEPPGGGCFQNPHVILADGKWAGKYTAGHSLLLLAGMVLGSPYLLPLLLAALVPLLVYGIGREMYDERVALLGAALFLVSPAFLFVSATLMNHATSLFCLALFTFAYLRSLPGRSFAYPVVAGLALGMALHIRPQDAIAYGAPFAVWSAIRLIRERRGDLLARQALMLSCFGVMAGLFLLYNKCITDRYLLVPIDYYGRLYPSPRSATASGPVLWGGRWSTRTALSFVKIARMNLWLFGWPFSLIFILSFLARGAVQRADRIHLGVIASIFLFYLVHGAHGLEELGARYYFPMLIPLVILTAREVTALHARLAVVGGARFRGAAVVPAFLGFSIVLSLVTFDTEKCIHFRSLSDAVAEPYRLVERSDITNAVVQIHSLPPAGWVFGHRLPNRDLSDDVLYVRATDPQDLLDLMDELPGRAFYWLGHIREKKVLVLDALSREEVQRDVRERAEKQAGTPPETTPTAARDPSDRVNVDASAR